MIPYLHPCFMHLVNHPTDVTQASFCGRAGELTPPADAVFRAPAVHELYHGGRVAARGIVDAECALVPDAGLPSRFSAISLRSVGDLATDVPCWAWGNGALVESVLRAVSVHTLVWETRMTG